MKENKRLKSITISVRLNAAQDELFKLKAKKYRCISAMIRDAVKQFDDTATKGKIDALCEMTALYKEYQHNLSWMGGNFNQMVKRANELSIAGQLPASFFEQILFPQVQEISKMLISIKKEQDKIVKKLIT